MIPQYEVRHDERDLAKPATISIVHDARVFPVNVQDFLREFLEMSFTTSRRAITEASRDGLAIVFEGTLGECMQIAEQFALHRIPHTVRKARKI